MLLDSDIVSIKSMCKSMTKQYDDYVNKLFMGMLKQKIRAIKTCLLLRMK